MGGVHKLAAAITPGGAGRGWGIPPGVVCAPDLRVCGVRVVRWSGLEPGEVVGSRRGISGSFALVSGVKPGRSGRSSSSATSSSA